MKTKHQNSKNDSIATPALRGSTDASTSDVESTSTPINILLKRTLDRIDNSSITGKYFSSIPTGFTDLDQRTSGLVDGELTVLASRPSMGKTIFALNIIKNICLAQNTPVILFSLKESAEINIIRLLSSIGSIDIRRILFGRLEDSDWINLAEAIRALKSQKLFIDDTPFLTVEKMHSKIQHIYRKYGAIALVIIDDFQHIHSDSIKNNKVSIARTLKEIAKIFSCPILLLSDVSIRVNRRSNKRPAISDLINASAIDKYADTTLFLYRDEYYNEESPEKGIAELIIGRNRLCTVRLRLLQEYSRFDNNPIWDDLNVW